MSEIRIDPEFRALIPPLTADEFAQLEKNVKFDGCRDPLVTWKGILLDGHNRLEICNVNNIHYNIHEIELPDRDAAKVWIIRNQFGRRNITMAQRLELAMLLEPLLKQQAKERLATSTGGTNPQPLYKCREGAEPPGHNWTDKTLARESGTSNATVHRYRKIKNNAIEPIQEMVKAGDISVAAGFAISKLPPEEQQEIAEGGADAAKEAIKRAVPESKPARTPQAEPSKYEATEAMQIAVMAISQLERIREDDPLRIQAFERVMAWINKHK